jgi:hypothetical protein
VNYFLSGWIENLGVEPWLLFLAFLSLPIFLSLFFLLIRVCVVLELISISLFKKISKIRPLYLYFIMFIVKGIFSENLYAAPLQSLANNGKSSIYMMKGQQKSFDLCQLENYSIGNKQIIRIKHQKKRCKLMVKAIKEGFSDLVIFTQSHRYRLEIYVTEAKPSPQSSDFINALKRLGLKIENYGLIHHITGEIAGLENYSIFKKLLNKQKDEYSDHTRLSKEFKNHLLHRIYTELYDVGAESVLCFSESSTVNCRLEGLDLDHPKIQFLQKNYHIQFDGDLSDVKNNHNLKISYKIIKLSSINSQFLDFPISKLQAQINKSFTAIETNPYELELRNNDISYEVVSTPTQIVMPGKEALFKLGQSIPYVQSTQNQVNTNWVFAGLKIKSKLVIRKNKLFWVGDVELSTPNGERISRTLDRTSVFISLNKSLNIFTIDMNGINKSEEYIEYLSKIPILGRLFTFTNNSQHRDKILIFLKVTKI